MLPIALYANELIDKAEKDLRQIFAGFDERAYANQRRVMGAFAGHRLTEETFVEKTGYGMHDHARDTIDNIAADIFQSEAAAIRMQFVSGTHAIACALAALTGTGDRIACVTGAPYDTLRTVLGIEGNLPTSLKKQGVDCVQVDVIPHLTDPGAARLVLKAALSPPTVLVHIQKSCGYAVDRGSLAAAQIESIAKLAKETNPGCTVFVDNCYGEFVEEKEPPDCGADLIAGSLIKNPGGGLAITGGYIAGTRKCVNKTLDRLTAPGLGGELGLLFNQNRLILQGLYMAPSVVCTALKSAALFAYAFRELGYEVQPGPFDPRYDIVQVIKFGSPEKLAGFCRSLQRYSPVSSHVAPEPSPMPGYTDEVIMAAGTFVQGSSIELSADGPLRPPYAAFLQGGLNYSHIRYALSGVLRDMIVGA